MGKSSMSEKEIIIDDTEVNKIIDELEKGEKEIIKLFQEHQKKIKGE